MASRAPSPPVLRFGPFELDIRSAELRRDSAPVKLSPQPVKLLALLAQHGGEVVTREEIQHQLWGDGTFVDFEQGLNFCIRQIREALGDDAHAPRYIETLPRRGYRFMVTVDVPAPAAAAARAVRRLIVLPFRMVRPDADLDFLPFSLPEAITTSLSGLESLVVRSSAAAARFAGESPDLQKVAAEADVDVMLAGSILRSGDQLRVSTQLTEVPTGTLVWAHTLQTSLGDAFQVQDELVRRIVESLAVPLTTRESRVFSRDVPSSSRAYECYLRGNQLSYDSKRWALARDLYLCAVEDDPLYAPAWARLGRMYHVMGKYLASGTDNFERAEVAFARALELNPDLPMAHKLYAQFDVDRGRAQKAMERLLGRARSADSEIFAGLVSACRYCGLLEASIAADGRARQLEPRVPTSVVHTHFLRGDHARTADAKLAAFPYVAALALGALGRGGEAIAGLRELEPKTGTRLREFMIAARTLLEGNRAESLAAVERLLSSDFSDPEGLFYLTRHLAHLNETETALSVFRRVVSGGFFCYPAMAYDEWLDPLRKKREFKELLGTAQSRHQEAVEVFNARNGKALLGSLSS